MLTLCQVPYISRFLDAGRWIWWINNSTKQRNHQHIQQMCFFIQKSCPSYQAKLVDLWTFRITHNPRNTLCSINNPPLCTLTQANLSHSSFLPSHSHSHLAHVLKLESSPFHFPRHPHIVHRQHGSSPPSAPPNLLLHPKCPHDSACAKWPCAPLVVGRLFWHHG